MFSQHFLVYGRHVNGECFKLECPGITNSYFPTQLQMPRAPRKHYKQPCTSKHIIFNTFDDKRINEPSYLRDFPQHVHRVFIFQKAFKLNRVDKNPVVNQETVHPQTAKQTPSTSNSASVQSASASSSRQAQVQRDAGSISSASNSASKNAFLKRPKAPQPVAVDHTGTTTRNDRDRQQQLSAQQADSHSPPSVAPNPQTLPDQKPQQQGIKTLAPDKSPAGLGNQISALPSDFEHIFHYSEAGQ